TQFGINPLTVTTPTGDLLYLLYDESGSPRDMSGVVGYYERIALFQTAIENLPVADQAVVIAGIAVDYGISNILAPTKAELNSGDFDILLFKENGSERTPQEVIDYYLGALICQAFYDVYFGLSAANRQKVDSILWIFTYTENNTTYHLDLSDGIQDRDRHILNMPEYGILYDENGQLRDFDAAMQFYLAGAEFRDAVIASSYTSQIDDILYSAFGIRMADGINITELNILGDPNFGILYDYGNLRNPYDSVAFYEAVVRFRQAVRSSYLSSKIDGVLNSAFGIRVLNGISRNELRIFGDPYTGILYDESGYERDHQDSVSFYELVVKFKEEVISSHYTSQIDDVLDDAFGIRVANGISSSELRSFGNSDYGILYDEDGHRRDIEDTVDFYEAVARFKQAVTNSDHKKNIDGLIDSLFGIRVLNGISKSELKKFGDSKLGILYDEDGDIRDGRAVVRFYELVIRFEQAVINSTYSEEIDDILDSAFGIKITDGIRLTELEKLGDSGLGILYDKDGARNIHDLIEFYAHVAQFKNAVINSDYAEEVDNILNSAFGIRLTDGVRRAELEKLGDADLGVLYDASGPRNISDVVEFYELIAQFKQELQSSTLSLEIDNLLHSSFGLRVLDGISLNELVILSIQDYGILYDEQGARQAKDIIKFYEAVCNFRSAYDQLNSEEKAKVDDIISVFTWALEINGRNEITALNLSDGLQLIDLGILGAKEYGIIYDEKGNIRDFDALFKYWIYYVERFEFLEPQPLSATLGITINDLSPEAQFFLTRYGITNNTLLRGVVTYTTTGKSWIDYFAVSENSASAFSLKVRFYAKPQIIDNREVQGTVVFDFGANSSLLGEDKIAKRGYTGTEPLRYIYYSDSDNKILTGLGIQGYVVETNDKIQGHENWNIIEEISPEGDFVIARAIGDYGTESATITKLIEEGYLITLIAEQEIFGDENPDRVIYKASEENGIYKFTDQDLYLNSYSEEEFALIIQGDSIIGLDSIFADLDSLPDSLREEAEARLSEGLLKIAESLGLDNQIHIVKERVDITGNGTKFNYRLKEDPWARIAIYVSSDNGRADVIINTEWDGESSILGYRFSPMGLMFKLESAALENLLTIQDILDKFGLNQSLIEDLEKRGIRANNGHDLAIVQIDEKLLIGDQEITILTRYTISNDPLYRDYARFDRGALRFIKLENGDSKAPFGISRGEVVVSPEIKKIIRETEFNMGNGYEYIYRVIYEYRDGEQYKNEPIFIGYNYKTGETWEHYVNEEWKLYSRDGIPLEITRLPGVNSAFSGDILYSSLTGEQREYLYSNFESRTYSDAGGNTYILISENILSPTSSVKATQRIIRNNKLWAISQDGFLRGDVYSVSWKDKFLNSIPGWVLNKITGGSVKDGENIEAMFNTIRDKGEKVDLNYSPHSETIFVDQERQALNFSIYAIFAAPFLFTLLIGLGTWFVSRRKDRKNLNYADYSSLVKLLRRAYSGNDIKVKELTKKIILLRQLNGPVVIGKNIPT
ncbi:hypothetical protein ACFL4C_03110, partial [Candidatus Omnitrophota bacterium]